MGIDMKPSHHPVPFTTAQLIAWRKAMGYSQRDASHALGCSLRSIQYWEKGDHEPPYHVGLACAALALGMAPYSPLGPSQQE